MHTTKFRGQILNGPRKGEWVYGSYLEVEVQGAKHARIIPIFDQKEEVLDGTIDIDCIAVDPKTVGQYIGLEDKKEREIYSDDIYIIRSYLGDDAEDYDNKYLVKYDDFSDCCVNGIGYSFGEHGSPADIEQIEVIGNRTDNPDLLTQ